jgi:hypothetical protein
MENETQSKDYTEIKPAAKALGEYIKEKGYNLADAHGYKKSDENFLDEGRGLSILRDLKLRKDPWLATVWFDCSGLYGEVPNESASVVVYDSDNIDEIKSLIDEFNVLQQYNFNLRLSGKDEKRLEQKVE